MQHTCQGPVIGTYTEEEAQALGRPNMAGHNKRGVEAGNGLIVPCGADLTDLIEDIDVDGRDYEVTCPRCGNVVSVRRVPGPPGGSEDGELPAAEQP